MKIVYSLLCGMLSANWYCYVTKFQVLLYIYCLTYIENKKIKKQYIILYHFLHLLKLFMLTIKFLLSRVSNGLNFKNNINKTQLLHKTFSKYWSDCVKQLCFKSHALKRIIAGAKIRIYFIINQSSSLQRIEGAHKATRYFRSYSESFHTVLQTQITSMNLCKNSTFYLQVELCKAF